MKPFEGIRVIDMTHVLAGPFATYQLAVLGADVIKVEHPTAPDMTRIEGATPVLNEALYGTYFMAQNGGKRALAVDIKTDAGRDILRKLVTTADVLVENYRVGALEELGLGHDDLAAINPKLIYCSLTGFGQGGPKRTHTAYDVVIQAYAGLMTSNGEENASPVRVGAPMVDYGTGAQAAFAIASALYQREKTGRGQRIDVAMADAALMLQCVMVAATQATGVPPQAHGNAHPRYAGYATYDCADGRIMIGAWTNIQMGRLFRALGDEDRAVRVEATPRASVGTLRPDDSEFLRARMAERTAHDWEAFLNGRRVPAARVRTLDETMAEAQYEGRAVLSDYAGSTEPGKPRALPVAGFTFAHGGPALSSPPPAVGEHTSAILADLGFDETAVAQFAQNGVVGIG
jgi:crotonobetainyl-CoA:carnitine CoA-transferase CaiB-like acyl-CoA transferase